jgi:L-aspartate oxidase
MTGVGERGPAWAGAASADVATAGVAGPRWRRDADVVVVGSGAAGISAALTAAAQGMSVLVITKDLTGGASPLAQGGLAAAIGPGDTASAHARDTVTAGVGLCDPDVVAALAAGAPGAVDWLIRRGAELEREALRLEGGHSARRIVHSGDDASGAEVHRALLEALLTSRIEILDRVAALDLSIARGDDPPGAWPVSGHAEGAVAGLVAATIGPGGELDPGLVSARAVILAAGGLGQAYATTSNPPGATGDALAIAARAGAVLRDPEFVQFHPTVLWLEGATGQCPLVTEALRGAGAVLRDLDGKPLMAGHDPRGDLAPRDVVAARTHEVMTVSGGQHVWLDATALGADVLEDGFPTVTAACRKHGTDPVTEYIPVAPGAHYHCGGIRAGLDGRTSVPGLYAVGESASTGVHGANRLASNSLVEAVIAGRRAGAAAAASSTAPEASAAAMVQPFIGINGTSSRPEPAQWHIHPAGRGVADAERGADSASRQALAAEMSRYAGVMRDADGLERLAAVIEGTPGRPATPLSLAAVEAANLHAVSELIATAALRRTESRGCHRRSDAPRTAPDARHTLLRRDGDQIRVTWEEQWEEQSSWEDQ